MTKYVVAASRPWFSEYPKGSDYQQLNIIEISKREELNLDRLIEINPRYIFFPHWSWKIEPDIFNRFECIVFHTAPLPYGRGGSPIQNLIIRGFQKAPVCALKVSEIMDGGPIYATKEISLEGDVDSIFERVASAVERLIVDICHSRTEPRAQIGEPFKFKRLSPSDNELSGCFDSKELFDRIRMVDGLTYPKAFIKFGNYRIEFMDARLEQGDLSATARFIEESKQKIRIEKATLSDSLDIFAWRNDPLSRAMFKSSKAVSYEEHDEWFKAALNDASKAIFLGFIKDFKVGICRFDFDPNNNRAEVSINLNPAARGKNLSVGLLNDAMDVYLLQKKVPIFATVRKENKASIRLFRRCGFEITGQVYLVGKVCGRNWQRAL